MDNFISIILVTYIYALFLNGARIRPSNKLFKLFKLILIFLAIISFIFLINYTGTLKLYIRITIYLPIPYILYLTFISDFNVFLNKIGVKITKRQKKIDNDLAEELMSSIDFLSKRKIGALITVERSVNLTPFINKALIINADVSKELLSSIFIPSTPLHDGAVIIRGNKVLCAKAYYPSTDRTDLPRTYGTRHRAAIGISEQSDALTIVVSEETGNVSVTINRQMEYNVSRETLNLYFEKFLQLN